MASLRTSAAALCLVVALLVPAAARAQDKLGSTTIIRGTTSSMATVKLAHAAIVHTGLPPFVATGKGRVIGFVLRPAGAPMTDTRTLVGMQFNDCWSASCSPGTPYTWSTVFGFEEQAALLDYRLPKGDYDLYLLADGAPTEVRLTLDGPEGTSTIEPSVPANAKIDVPAPTPTSYLGPSALAYSAGSSNPIAAPGGLLLAAARVTGTGPGDVEGSFCWYPDGDSGIPSYQGCAGSTVLGLFGKQFGAVPDGLWAFTAAVVATRPWVLGMFADGLVSAPDPHLLSVGLTYRPTDDETDAVSTTNFITEPRTTR